MVKTRKKKENWDQRHEHLSPLLPPEIALPLPMCTNLEPVRKIVMTDECV